MICKFEGTKAILMRFLTILTLALLFSCSNGIDKVAAENQKNDNLEKNQLSEESHLFRNPGNYFRIGNEEIVLKTSKYSRIHIPKNAFVKKNGESVEMATVVFREYQSQGEILASGLPMVCKNEKGELFDFESAGMFEIRAFDGKDTLFLREGKEVKVELASPVGGKFNFYELNDNTRSWKERESNLSAISNPYLKQTMDSLKLMESVLNKGMPKKAMEYKPSDKLLDIKVDPEKYPEFKEIGGVMWKYAGKKKENDPANNAEYFTRNYAFVELMPVKGGVLAYDVSFVFGNDTLKLLMAPVFPGKLKAKYQKKFEEKLKKFNEALEESQVLRKQQRNESELLRVFNLDKLGVFNYDRQLKGNNIQVLASFFLGDKKQSDFKGLNVYLVPEGKMCVIKYDIETAEKFAINLAERNRLIAIVSPEEVYALSDNDIRKLNLSNYQLKKCEIHLKKIDKKVTSGVGVDQVLVSL